MPFRIILGLVIALAGAGVLAALLVALYRAGGTQALVDLGIPGALLAALAGLCALFIGGAILVRAAMASRRRAL